MKKIVILISLVSIFFTSCVLTEPDGRQSEDGTEPFEIEEQITADNPLISQEMWGDAASIETAEKLYLSVEHRRFDYYRFNRDTEYSRMETDSQNWILKNQNGQTLYCKDGVLYGDMPYYRPVDMGIDKGYLYDGAGDALFIEYSEEFVFIPADMNASELVITMPAPGVTVNEDETVVWSYDDGYNAVAMTTYGLYMEIASIQNIPFEWGIYLRDGIGVETVVVANNKVIVSGEDARYANVQSHGLEPHIISFK